MPSSGPYSASMLLRATKAASVALAMIALTACGGGGEDSSAQQSTSSTPGFAETGSTLPDDSMATKDPAPEPTLETNAALAEAAQLNAAELAEAQAQSLGTTKSLTKALSTVPVYRFHNRNTGAHFYTTSEAERDSVRANLSGMTYEGQAFQASSQSASGLSPVYRFYNLQTGVHFYTISADERAHVLANLPQFRPEGVAYHASKVAGTAFAPLYRSYVPSHGFHFYSTNPNETDGLPQYHFEGLAYYVIGTTPASGPNAVVAGTLSAPFPTLENISLEWPVSGDANRNSVASLRYRVQGNSTWRQGLPLRRVVAGSNSNTGLSWGYRHVGSVFDLQSDTLYEVQVTLTDPDGGSVTRSLNVRTRPVPAAMAGAPVKAATPATLASVLSSAQPGDIVQLSAGTYSGFNIDNSGSEGRPVVVRAAPGASVVVNGEIGVFMKQHIHLSGLTVNGRIRFNGSHHMSITRNTINASASRGGDGIVTFLRAENSYIADNVVNGLTPWAEASLGVNGSNQGEGILVTGPGHVIQNNRVRGMRDGISFLEGSEAVDQYSIDILNNHISESADDGVEADFCQHNCRIMRNRITNSFIALSSQPGLGGPTYFIRNAVYNAVHLAFKQYRGSTGDVLLHNTVVKMGDAFANYSGEPVNFVYMRNNWFVGGLTGTYNGYDTGLGRVIQAPDLVNSTLDADFDAFGSSTGFAQTGGSLSYFTGQLGSTTFTSLATLRASTNEKNAIDANLNSMATPLVFPNAPMTPYASPDLRPRADSLLANAGVALPNINDGFAGSAPDIGAFEAGAALPTYGPR